uniref:RING-type domain-containing protein n=1 Tax=Labrus bergylta TaxID=56723 RepID=A0A3Q3FP92_9LABR
MSSPCGSQSTSQSFLCSICLDVFNDPVSTSCGHNFCKTCITEHWNTSDQYRCPICMEAFTKRPELRINTLLSEIVGQFRDKAQQGARSSSSELQESKPGEILCDVCTGTKLKALKSWKDVAQLDETLSEEMKKLVQTELKRDQQYAVDVTLDPDTAHPNLILSKGGRQVYLGDVTKNLPDNPERFSSCVYVLGKQSFSSGRFYFEVQSINRKGEITVSPEKALDDPSVRLSLKCRPEKVRVFVDYEEGLVSFYDVGAAALIYSFTDCSFTEKLFPVLGPCLIEGGKNSAPLIISPVSLK